MDLKKVKHLILALAAAALVTVIVAYCFQSVVLCAISVGLCVACIAVELALWRCPYCGEYLGRQRRGKYCPHCGQHLVDLE